MLSHFPEKYFTCRIFADTDSYIAGIFNPPNMLPLMFCHQLCLETLMFLQKPNEYVFKKSSIRAYCRLSRRVCDHTRVGTRLLGCRSSRITPFSSQNFKQQHDPGSSPTHIWTARLKWIIANPVGIEGWLRLWDHGTTCSTMTKQEQKGSFISALPKWSAFKQSLPSYRQHENVWPFDSVDGVSICRMCLSQLFES